MDQTPDQDIQLDEVDEIAGILQLISGEIDHEPFWAYVSMYPSKYAEYSIKVERQESVVIDDYGTVIEKGWGSLPPEEVQQRMKEEFNVDHSFQDKLDAMAEDLKNDIESDLKEENKQIH